MKNQPCSLPFRAMALSTLLAGCATGPQTKGAPEEVTLSIVGTSDLHGHVEPRTFQVKDKDGQPKTVSRGGLALFGGYLENLRRKQPVILLDGGDLFQGTLASNLGEGQAVIDGYNALGYTAAAIGNHEFDYGPSGPRAVPKEGTQDDPTGALKERIRSAKFPFLSANVLDKQSGKPVTWENTYPSRLIEVPSAPWIRLGIIGATAEDTPRTTNPLNLRELSIGKVVDTVRQEALSLKQQGATAVVLVVHEGADCKRFDDPRDLSSCRNVDERLLSMANALQGDLAAVVGGHSHAAVAHYAGRVPVIQAYMGGRAFGRIDLRFRKDPEGARLLPEATKIFAPTDVCSVAIPEAAAAGVAQAAPAAPPPSDGEPGAAAQPTEVAGTAGAAGAAKPKRRPQCDRDTLSGTAMTQATYEGLPVAESAAVAGALAPHIQKAVKLRDEKIGVTAPDKLSRNYRAESSMGTLLADLIREGAQEVSKTKIDVAFQNGGGIRAELPRGELTYGDVYEVLPFDNRLAILKMPGSALYDLIAANLQGSSGVLIPGGLSVEAKCDAGALKVELRDSAGVPLDPKKVYSVATSDFLAAGGDNFSKVLGSLNKGAITYYDDAPPLREIILSAMRKRGTLAQEKGLNLPPRLRLPMPRPVRCEK